MQNDERRKLIKAGGALLATGVAGALGVSAVQASSHGGPSEHAGHGGHMMSPKGIDAFVVSADKVGVCATCRYWGGIRRISEDKKTVHCDSLGWCNNANSHHFQSKTTPATGPMKSWQKWEAI